MQNKWIFTRTFRINGFITTGFRIPRPRLSCVTSLSVNTTNTQTSEYRYYRKKNTFVGKQYQLFTSRKLNLLPEAYRVST